MKRILIVGDNEQARRLLMSFIVKKFPGVQFEFFEANNGLEALEILEKTKVSIVLTDVVMPIMDGISLIINTKKRHNNIPIIALSADRERLKDAKSSGADCVIERCATELYYIFPSELKNALCV